MIFFWQIFGKCELFWNGNRQISYLVQNNIYPSRTTCWNIKQGEIDDFKLWTEYNLFDYFWQITLQLNVFNVNAILFIHDEGNFVPMAKRIQGSDMLVLKLQKEPKFRFYEITIIKRLALSTHRQPCTNIQGERIYLNEWWSVNISTFNQILLNRWNLAYIYETFHVILQNYFFKMMVQQSLNCGIILWKGKSTANCHGTISKDLTNWRSK